MENIVINRGYRPKLMPCDYTDTSTTRALNLLNIKIGSLGEPCFSSPGIDAAFWQSDVNEAKEAGIICKTRLEGIDSYFFGIYEDFDAINLRYEATSIAEYSAPKLDIALKGLAKFLFPDKNFDF